MSEINSELNAGQSPEECGRVTDQELAALLSMVYQIGYNQAVSDKEGEKEPAFSIQKPNYPRIISSLFTTSNDGSIISILDRENEPNYIRLLDPDYTRNDFLCYLPDGRSIYRMRGTGHVFFYDERKK